MLDLPDLGIHPGGMARSPWQVDLARSSLQVQLKASQVQRGFLPGTTAASKGNGAWTNTRCVAARSGPVTVLFRCMKDRPIPGAGILPAHRCSERPSGNKACISMATF